MGRVGDRGPLLTGYWRGEVTFAPGDVRRFVLRLDDDTWPWLRTRAQENQYGPGRYLQNLEGDPDIEGQWHGDQLTLRVAVARHETVGGAHAEAPVEVTLKRSTKDEFAAPC